MGKSSPQTPQAPDPYAVSAAQTQMNNKTAEFNADINRMNTYTPYGSQTYTKTPGAETYDNAAFQNALKNWQSTNGGGGGAQSQPGPSSSSGFMPGFNDVYGNGGKNNAGGGQGAVGGANASGMPTLDQFKTGSGAPSYSSNINLAPDLQASLDAQMGQDKSLNQFGNSLIPQIQSALGKGYDTSDLAALRGGASGGNIQRGLDYSGAPQLPGTDDFSADRTKVENALYSRIDPKLQRNEDDLRNRLANQGIMQGSEAYGREMDDMNQAKNDAYNQAILAGGQEQSRLFGLGLNARQQAVGEQNAQGAFANSAQNQAYGQDYQNAQLSNSARQQGLQEQAMMRSQPLNDLMAIRGGTPIQTPQFSPAYNAAANPADLSGNVWNSFNAQQDAYNQKVASNNATTNGLYQLGGTLGSAAIFMSDRRLKEDIERIGQTPARIPVYSFKYKGNSEPQTGVMAQDIENIIPQAVITNADGFKMVNYALVR